MMSNGARLVCVTLLFCIAMSTAVLAASTPSKSVTLTPDQLRWVPSSAAPEVKTAAAWGEVAKGAHGPFHKLPAGFTAPLHTHSANTRIVVISGTLAIASEDGKETKLPSGSFFTQPNTFKHTTKCAAGAECLIYVEADAAWDLKPAAAK